MKKVTSTSTKKVKSVAAARRSSSYSKRAPKKEVMPKEPILSDEMEQDMDEELDTVPASAPMSASRRALFIVIGILLLVGIAGYRYRHLLTPAVINGKPIFVWEYFWKLHQQFGNDQLNSMATEEVIKQAVANANVTVPKEDIDKEVEGIEKEASASGGVQAILDAQRISMDELRERISLQLAVKKILADKIKVSEQEINDSYSKNKDFYKGIPEAQAKETIKKQLEDQKFQTEVGVWLADVRAKAKVEIKFPGIQAPVAPPIQ